MKKIKTGATVLIKFAVCDDERDVAEYVSDKLREYYPNECEIKKYTDGKSLLADSRREYFDAFFLDVGMPSLDGFEIAREIRNNDPRVKIIFVTRKEELAHLGYIYGAFRFVRKSRLDQDLCETAESLNRSLSLSGEYISFKTPTGKIMITVKDIKFLKVNGHSVILYSPDERRICGTMQEHEERLKNRGFIRIHKSYLVNFKYLNSLERKSVKLTTGEELPLSRCRIVEVKKRIQECCQARDK